jgi:hypothetical protein
MQEPSASFEQPRRPVPVVAAACLFVAGGLLGAVPLKVLFALSEPSELRWYFAAYYPGWWAVAPLLVLLALFVFRGLAWSRYVAAVLVVGLLLVQVSFGSRLHNFPLATARDVMSTGFQVAAVVLLFLPSASRWFSRRRARSAT